MTPTWGDLIRRVWAIVRANYTLAQMTYYDELGAERRAVKRQRPPALYDTCTTPSDESYTRPQGSK
jgi:hypothetical protein